LNATQNLFGEPIKNIDKLEDKEKASKVDEKDKFPVENKDSIKDNSVKASLTNISKLMYLCCRITKRNIKKRKRKTSTRIYYTY